MFGSVHFVAFKQANKHVKIWINYIFKCICSWITHGFSLPERVDDAAPLVADDIVVPQPRFGIDRFADGAQNSE